jgi:hypothetical protein
MENSTNVLQIIISAMVVEPGKYEILIGTASDDIRLKLPMTITAR